MIGDSMKLEYNARNHIKLLFLAPVLIFLKFYELYRKGDTNLYNYAIIVIFIVAFVLVYIIIFIYKVIVNKRFIKYGTKVQGYIVDSCFFGYNKNRNHMLKFWYDNKIYTIDKVSYNEAYRFIENDLNSIKQIYTDPSQIKKYPIDIYFYNGKYSADLGSVKFDENL